MKLVKWWLLFVVAPVLAFGLAYVAGLNDHLDVAVPDRAPETGNGAVDVAAIEAVDWANVAAEAADLAAEADALGPAPQPRGGLLSPQWYRQQLAEAADDAASAARLTAGFADGGDVSLARSLARRALTAAEEAVDYTADAGLLDRAQRLRRRARVLLRGSGETAPGGP